jgi:tetratricopeptide (TPR) repeat protein
MKKVNHSILTIFLIIVFATPCVARISLVVFPFKNISNDNVYSWISAVFPETAYRILFTNNSIRLFDPIFMFQTDSSSWEMNSDSLILQHKKRWKWDAAIGGNYKISKDSIYFSVKIAWSADENEPVNMEFSGSEHLSKSKELCYNLLKKGLSLVQASVPDQNAQISNNQERGYQTYSAGYLFEMKGNIAAASTAYARALEIDPELLFAACRLGRLQCLQQKYENAKALYLSFLDIYPDDPMVCAFMVEAAGNASKFEEAARFVDQYRVPLGKSSKGLCASGYIYLKQGAFSRAVSSLSQAKASGAENLDVEFFLGQALLNTGDYQRAIDIFNQLIQIRPDYQKYYVSLGDAYKKSGQLMQASIAMQSALAKGKPDVSMMIDLSQIWIELKWYQKALHLLEQAQEMNPEIPDIMINKAIALWHTGKRIEAKDLFEKSMKFSSVRQTALINMGNFYFYDKEYRKALSYYKEANTIEKQNALLEFDLAITYEKLGNLSKALYHFDQSLEFSPEGTDILFRCADISIKLKKNTEAIYYLKRILEFSPQEENAIRKIVDIYINIGNYEDATSMIEEYLSLVPSSTDIIILLANIYRMRGWCEVAIEKFQDIIRAYPELPDGYLGLGICMIEQVKKGQRSDFDNIILTLNYAEQKSRGNSAAEIALGDLYFYQKADKGLAIQYWNKALKKSNNEIEKKQLIHKINSVQ